MTNPVPSPDFRPNPARGVFLSEKISQATLDRLTPTIVRLQAESRAPITLFIDSLGGNIVFARTLRSLLRSSDQDQSEPCRLITVATGIAGSAAADLLMAGNYSLAHPHALILCHGVRQQGGPEAITHEKAIDLAKDLADSNEQFAIQLADNCIFRFIFRVAYLSSEFPESRQRRGDPSLPHTECFIEALKGRIPANLIELLEKSLKHSVDNDNLDVFVANSLRDKEFSTLPAVQREVLLLKSILDYEFQQHSTEVHWSFFEHGIQRIQDKLELLVNKYDEHHSEMISLLCDRWGDGEYFLPPEHEKGISDVPEPERSERIREAIKNVLSTLWFFFVSTCRSLQKKDYWMTAETAYWLGLIDEVIGRSDLPCPRAFIEYPPTENEDSLRGQQTG